MDFHIGANYSECLLRYIKLLTSTNKYYTLGCCGNCVPSLSRLSKVCSVERQSQSQILKAGFGFSILVVPSAPYFMLHCTYPFGAVFSCLWIFHFGDLPVCPASQVSSFSSLNNSFDLKVQNCCCWQVTRSAEMGMGSCTAARV